MSVESSEMAEKVRQAPHNISPQIEKGNHTDQFFRIAFVSDEHLPLTSCSDDTSKCEVVSFPRQTKSRNSENPEEKECTRSCVVDSWPPRSGDKPMTLTQAE
jgi:hypothetical protein